MAGDGGGGKGGKGGLKLQGIHNSTLPLTAATVIRVLSLMKLASASNIQPVFLHFNVFVHYSEVSESKPKLQSRSHTF